MTSFRFLPRLDAILYKHTHKLSGVSFYMKENFGPLHFPLFSRHLHYTTVPNNGYLLVIIVILLLLWKHYLPILYTPL